MRGLGRLGAQRGPRGVVSSSWEEEEAGSGEIPKGTLLEPDRTDLPFCDFLGLCMALGVFLEWFS